MKRPLPRSNSRSTESGAGDHDEATRNRLRSVAETGGYDYDEAERDEVEARLRRMVYGARVEGAKARPDPHGDAHG